MVSFRPSHLSNDYMNLRTVLKNHEFFKKQKYRQENEPQICLLLNFLSNSPKWIETTLATWSDHSDVPVTKLDVHVQKYTLVSCARMHFFHFKLKIQWETPVRSNPNPDTHQTQFGRQISKSRAELILRSKNGVGLILRAQNQLRKNLIATPIGRKNFK